MEQDAELLSNHVAAPQCQHNSQEVNAIGLIRIQDQSAGGRKRISSAIYSCSQVALTGKWHTRLGHWRWRRTGWKSHRRQSIEWRPCTVLPRSLARIACAKQELLLDQGNVLVVNKGNYGHKIRLPGLNSLMCTHRWKWSSGLLIRLSIRGYSESFRSCWRVRGCRLLCWCRTARASTLSAARRISAGTSSSIPNHCMRMWRRVDVWKDTMVMKSLVY